MRVCENWMIYIYTVREIEGLMRNELSQLLIYEVSRDIL